MMTSFLAAIVGSFSWWMTGWLASTGSPIVSLDHPNERSLHRTPTPRTGGVAVMGALYLGVLILGVLGWIRSSPDESMPMLDSTGWSILVMTGVISIVSLMDDRRGLPIAVRFGVHFLASALLVIGSGLVLPPIAVPCSGSSSWDGSPLLSLSCFSSGWPICTTSWMEWTGLPGA